MTISGSDDTVAPYHSILLYHVFSGRSLPLRASYTLLSYTHCSNVKRRRNM